MLALLIFMLTLFIVCGHYYFLYASPFRLLNTLALSFMKYSTISNVIKTCVGNTHHFSVFSQIVCEFHTCCTTLPNIQILFPILSYMFSTCFSFCNANSFDSGRNVLEFRGLCSYVCLFDNFVLYFHEIVDFLPDFFQSFQKKASHCP